MDWKTISNDPDFKKLSEKEKYIVRKKYYTNVITKDPEFNALSPLERREFYDKFMGIKYPKQGWIKDVYPIVADPLKAAMGIPVDKKDILTGGDNIDLRLAKAAFNVFPERVKVPLRKETQPIINRFRAEPIIPKEESTKRFLRRPGLFGAGVYAGERVSPRDIAGVVREAAIDPRTYVTLKPTRTLADKTINSANNIVKFGKRITNLSRPQYLYNVILPKAQGAIARNLKNFTNGIQNYAIKKKVPKAAVDTIKKFGYNMLKKLSKQYDTDTILSRIEVGFDRKRSVADAAYRSVLKNTPPNKIIPIKKFFYTMRNALRKKGFIDLDDNLTARAEELRDPFFDKLIRMYKDVQRHIVSGGKKMPTGGINKEDFLLYRDLLNNLYKDNPTSVITSQIKKSLLDDVENAGIEGIKRATSLEKEAFEAEKLFYDKTKGVLRSGIKNMLNRFHKLNSSDLQQLRNIEKYIDVKFVDDLDKIAAAKYLDDIEQSLLSDRATKNVASQLNNALQKKSTDFVKNQLSDILGEATDDIFNEIIKHRDALRASTIGRRLLYGGAMVALGYPMIRKVGRRMMGNKSDTEDYYSYGGE